MPTLLYLPPEHAHQLLLLYLSLAFGADSALDPHERQTAVRLARTWAPEWTEAEVDHAVDAAVSAMRAGLVPPPEAIARSLRSALSRERRRRVLGELGRIARADGHVLVSEANVIRRIRSVWDRATSLPDAA